VVIRARQYKQILPNKQPFWCYTAAMRDNTPQIEILEEEFTKISKTGKKFRDSTFARFPILFTLLTTFGLVATLYGFEKMLDRIDLFDNHPEILIVLGIAVLAGTGSLYKKLS
jgi:hypothetical protein